MSKLITDNLTYIFTKHVIERYRQRVCKRAKDADVIIAFKHHELIVPLGITFGVKYFSKRKLAIVRTVFIKKAKE